MYLDNLPLIDQITALTWYYVKQYFGHTYTKLPDRADEGFEDQFRDFVFRELKPVYVSETHDLGMGADLPSASGLKHEIDLIATWKGLTVVFELKNCQVDKGMVMIFHQKCLDYFIENTASLQSQALERVFLTNSSVMDVRIRQFCMLWGIHLVDKEWPPLSQCKLWLDAIETSFQKTGGTHPDLRSIGDDIAVIEDNCHTDLNQILKRKDEITFEISPNVDVRVEDLVERERQLIDKTKKLMRSSRGHNG